MEKMSACGEFADHLWKPGSCKNCFHPSSAHSCDASLDRAMAGADADEHQCLTLTSAYSKPTIAVRPTMMNPDTLDMLTDVNMNPEQESRRCVTDKLNLVEMLELDPLYRSRNDCCNTLKDAASEKMDHLCRFSCDTPAHKAESLFFSSIQEEGSGPVGLKEGGPSRGFWFPVTEPMTSSCHIPPAPLESQRMTSSGSCEGQRGCVPVGEQKRHSGLAFAIDILSTSPASRVISSEAEPPNASDGVTPCCSAQGGLLLNCRCVHSSAEPSGVSETCSCPSQCVRSPGVSETCSCPPSMDLPGRLREKTWAEEPQALLILSSSPSDVQHCALKSEPIYAESSKRKKKSFPAQQCPALNGDPAVDDLSAKNDITAGSTGEPNSQILYLTSSGSAVSILWPHLSSTGGKDSSTSSCQSCCSSGEINAGSVQSRPRVSPPIPPKRTSCSPKFGCSGLSPAPHPEVHLHPSGASQLPCLAPGQNMAQAQFETSIPTVVAVEPRWSLLSVQTEDEVDGGKEMVPQCRTSRSTNPAAVLEPRDWSPDTLHNKGLSQPAAPQNGLCRLCLDKHKGSLLSSGSSSAAALSEGWGLGPDTTPPPPPPKKHYRLSGKMNMVSSDVEKTISSDSIQGLAPPQRILTGGFSASSPDGLSSIPRILSDRGKPCVPFMPNLSLCLTSSLVLPLSDPTPGSLQGISPALPQHPPPLPEKRLINRTLPGPKAEMERWFSTKNPHFLPSRPESDICGSDRTSSVTVAQLSPYSSASSPQLSAVTTLRPLQSRASDLLLQKGSNLCRSSPCSFSCSSPQLAVPSASSSPLGTALHAGSSPQLATLPAGSSHPCATPSAGSSPQLAAPPTGSSPQLGTPSAGSSPQLIAPPAGSSSELAALPEGSSLHLQVLLSHTDSWEGVYSKLGGLYAESLRRLALKCEEHFTRSQRNPLRFDESSWSLFKLTRNQPCCEAADGFYYAASCALDPLTSYAVKICKSSVRDATHGHLYGLSVQQSIPPHFSLQQDCGHFIARIPPSMLPTEEADRPLHCGDQERVVVITRDVPHQSAARFVQDCAAFHQFQPEVYERRVCFLLLQLCTGLEHLKEHGITHCNLCLENLLLVPRAHKPGGGCNQNHLPRLLLSSFAKAKRHSAEHPADDPLLSTDRSRLAPEILSASQHCKIDEFQTGILIYEFLHQPNPFKVRPQLKEWDYHCEDLPSVPTASPYSAGLQRLARLLLHSDPAQRIHIQEAKRALQSLLWGPRPELLEQQRGRPADGPHHDGLLNWLDVKRALLMMRFAERSLEPDQSAELEDWLCCQYFSSANPVYLCSTADLLYSN